MGIGDGEQFRMTPWQLRRRKRSLERSVAAQTSAAWQGWRTIVFPYRDENATQRTPYVTIAIIALNVLAWLFVQGAGQTLPLAESVCNRGLIAGELTGALPPGTAFPMGDRIVCYTDPGRQPLNLVTSMFLHGSWLHLLGNMWFFWIFGNNIEDSMGHGRFVFFYLLSGLAAAL